MAKKLTGQLRLGASLRAGKVQGGIVSGLQPSNFEGAALLGLRPRLVCDALSARYGYGGVAWCGYGGRGRYSYGRRARYGHGRRGRYGHGRPGALRLWRPEVERASCNRRGSATARVSHAADHLHESCSSFAKVEWSSGRAAP